MITFQPDVTIEVGDNNEAYSPSKGSMDDDPSDLDDSGDIKVEIKELLLEHEDANKGFNIDTEEVEDVEKGNYFTITLTLNWSLLSSQ